MKSVAEKSFDLTGLFEAEVFVRLMLWRWNHPLADDKEYPVTLLETASSILREACNGQSFIESVPASDLNLIAAVWYAEYCSMQEGGEDSADNDARSAWLKAVRQALPSCFCDPSDLPPA